MTRPMPGPDRRGLARVCGDGAGGTAPQDELMRRLIEIQQRMLRPIIWNEETAEILQLVAESVGAGGGILWRREMRQPGAAFIRQGEWRAPETPARIELTGTPLEDSLRVGTVIDFDPGLPSGPAVPRELTGGKAATLRPLISRDRLFGILVIQSPGSIESSGCGSESFLSLVAVSFAMALDRSHYHRELKESQKRLRQSQKMEAIGQFAGGIAHDFNNLLTVIRGNAELLRERVAGDLLSAQMNEEVRAAADRAVSLTRQLVTFARTRTLDLRSLDLNSVLPGIQPMLARLLGETIRLESDLCREVLGIKGNAHSIEQVLLNLAANARDAMPRGGRLRFVTRRREFSPGEAGLPKGQKPQPYASIEVEDTGEGISEELIEHIFEPFFTTKPVGQGSGLGLATAYAIVQQHGGWIDVESEVGKGTVIRLFFPLLEGEEIDPVDVGVGQRPDQRRTPPGQTILLVEDEEAVLRMTRMALELSGFRVITATSGPAALAAWKDCKEEIRLLMSDIVMPEGMNGITLAGLMREEQPALKVLLVSGYSNDLPKVATRTGHTAFLQKPYEVDELKVTIRDLLGAGGS